MSERKEIVDPAEILRKQIAEMNERVDPGESLPIVRNTQDKHFVLPSGNKVAGPIRGVIVDFINENMYYKKDFTKGDDSPPDCFARGYKLKELAPDPELVKEPIHPVCAGCPMKEWGSGRNGSQACKGKRIIAFKLLGTGSLALVRASSTAAKGFDRLMADLASRNVPPLRLTVEMGFNAQLDYPSIVFEPIGNNDDFETDVNLLSEARSMLETIPRPVEE